MRIRGLVWAGAVVVGMACAAGRGDIILDNVDSNNPSADPAGPVGGPASGSKLKLAAPAEMAGMLELARKHDEYLRAMARWTWKPRLVLPTSKAEDAKLWSAEGGKIEMLADGGMKVVTEGKKACWVTYIGKERGAGEFKGPVGVAYEAMAPKEIRPCDLSVRLTQTSGLGRGAGGAEQGGIAEQAGGDVAIVGGNMLADVVPVGRDAAGAEVLLFQFGGWHNAQNLYKVNGEAKFRVGGPAIVPGKWQNVEVTYGPARATGSIEGVRLMDEALRVPVTEEAGFVVALYVYDSTGVFRNVTVLGPGEKPEKQKVWEEVLGKTTEGDLRKVAEAAAGKLGDGSFRVREAATEVLYNLRGLSNDAVKGAIESKDAEVHSRGLDVAKKMGIECAKEGVPGAGQ